MPYIVFGAVFQFVFSRCVGSGFWRKLFPLILIAICTMLAPTYDALFECLCVLVGAAAGACVHWVTSQSSM